MAGANKSSVIISIVLILFSLSLAGVGFYLYQKEHAASLTLKQELGAIQEKEKILQAKLDESKNTVSTLEAKAQDSLAQISALNSQLEEEKNRNTVKTAEIEQLTAELEGQKESQAALGKKIEQAEKDAETMHAQLKELESKKTELDTKIKDLEGQLKSPQSQGKQQGQAEGVELGKIVVNPETAIEKEKAKAPGPGLEGKVLVVNKDYNFAVINVGNKDAVEVGDIFSVYNGSKNIGMIKVDRVHDSMSAASFISSELKDKVKEGDKVVRKTK